MTAERTDDRSFVRQIVRDHLAVEPSRIRRMTFGHSSRVYDATLPDRHVIVRLNANPRVFRGTAHTLTDLGQLGLPVPMLLAGDLTLTRYPVAYLLLEKIAGQDLRFALPRMGPVQMVAVAQGIVAIQRQVTGLQPGQGYGFVPLGERGPFSTWRALLDRDVARALASTAGALPSSMAGDFRDALDRHRQYLDRVPAVCFLDDLTTKNVIIWRGRLKGIVDLDVVCYGDPLYWLALTVTAVLADVGQAGRPYLDALHRGWPEGAANRAVVALYAAAHGLDFLGRALGSGHRAAGDQLLHLLAGWIATAREAESTEAREHVD